MAAEYNCAAEQKSTEYERVTFTKSQRIYLKLKRAIDIMAALFGLIVLSPLFLGVAAAIKLEEPHGSVLHTQERIGRKGTPFLLYKFRSMRMGTPELSTHEFYNAQTYITRVGRFIRCTSIDELPQLWNVLVGNMSLVGPRPLLIRERDVHMKRFFYGLYQVRPGITGLAQTRGRDDMSDEDKVYWDKEYVAHISLRNDFRILMDTVYKVVKREGVLDKAGPEKEEKTEKKEKAVV